jgi:hypothetical protein
MASASAKRPAVRRGGFQHAMGDGAPEQLEDVRAGRVEAGAPCVRLRTSGRRRVTVLPPITRPGSSERVERVVGALAALLLAQTEGGAVHEDG